MLFRCGALLRRERGARLVLNLRSSACPLLKTGVEFSHRNLKINHLIGKGGHFVIEAHTVLADFLAGKDEFSLSFLGIFHDDLFVWPNDTVVDIKSSARLNLP